MSKTETKELSEKLLSEWETFKTKNDERLKVLEDGDPARAKEIDAELDKYNNRLDELEVKIKKVHSEAGKDEDIQSSEFERKYIDAFLRDKFEDKKSFKSFVTDIKQGNVPEELKDLNERKDRLSLAMDIESLPENLKTYGRAVQKKAMSTDSLADGGVFSLPNFELSVIKGIRELSPIRQVARIIVIGSGDSWTGRVRATTISSQNAGERENVSNTGTPTYKEIRIQTHERSASPALTNQMIEDAFMDIVGEVQRDGQEEFAVQEGTQFISGTGVDEAEGILTNTDITSTDSKSNTLFDFDDLMDLQSSLKQGYMGMFLFSRQTRGFIRKLKDSNNQYLWSPNVAAGAPNSILGDPYLLATDLASPVAGVYSANDVPVLYGDFQRGYYIIDRLGLTVLRDPYSNRPFIEIYMRRRYGGQVVLAEAIKKLTTTT